MRLTYLYHSGFSLEGDGITIIIDYWRDTNGADGYVHQELLHRPGQIYVLASHFHEDHFNPEVLKWREQRPDIVYILSKDILRHRRATKDDAFFLVKGSFYEDAFIHVHAFGSTDCGISLLIEVEGKKLFHAGDLNNWHWTDESTTTEAALYEKQYLGELRDIRKSLDFVDVVCFPVDARIGTDFSRGAQQFIESVKISLFIPMHFTANGFESVAFFEDVAKDYGTSFWKIQYEGESIFF